MDSHWCFRHPRQHPAGPLGAELWDMLQGCMCPGFCSGLGGSWRIHGVVRGGSERAVSHPPHPSSSPPILAFQGWACSDEGHRPPSAGLRVNSKERKKPSWLQLQRNNNNSTHQAPTAGLPFSEHFTHISSFHLQSDAGAALVLCSKHTNPHCYQE